MKKFFLLLLFLLALFFSPDKINAEEVNLFEVSVIVNQDGTISVVETIVYDFGENARHGIFREIPFFKTNAEGKKFVLAIADIRVLDEADNPYPFTRSEDGGMLRLKIGNPNRTITGIHTYVVSYQVSGALTYYSDHDELYWNVTGNAWEIPIQKVQVSIGLAEGIDSQYIRLECFTGSSGSVEKTCESRVDDEGHHQVAAGPFAPGEGLTIVAGFPKGLVEVLRPRPYVTFLATIWGKLVIVVVAMVAFLWYIVTPGIVVYRWFKYGRDPQPAMGAITAWFDAPKTRAKRRLRPAEAGTLLDETVDTRDIFATIIDLARRGYLRIIEAKKNDFSLEKRDAPKGDEPLLAFEQTLLASMFRSGGLVNVKHLKLYEKMGSIQKALYDQVVSDGYFPQSPQSIRTLYRLLAVFALLTGNIMLVIIAFTFGMAMPRKTLFGAEESAVVKSLKNFLSSQEKKLAFQAKNQMFFEKFLPFAVAFGVEKIWADRFAEIRLTQPEWYHSSGGSYANTTTFARSLGGGLGRSLSYAASPRSSSGFSSGLSGGGSSGGGGGGGGGGSW